jgi:hypothetical protein
MSKRTKTLAEKIATSEAKFNDLKTEEERNKFWTAATKKFKDENEKKTFENEKSVTEKIRLLEIRKEEEKKINDATRKTKADALTTSCMAWKDARISAGNIYLEFKKNNNDSINNALKEILKQMTERMPGCSPVIEAFYAPQTEAKQKVPWTLTDRAKTAFAFIASRLYYECAMFPPKLFETKVTEAAAHDKRVLDAVESIAEASLLRTAVSLYIERTHLLDFLNAIDGLFVLKTDKSINFISLEFNSFTGNHVKKINDYVNYYLKLICFGMAQTIWVKPGNIDDSLILAQVNTLSLMTESAFFKVNNVFYSAYNAAAEQILPAKAVAAPAVDENGEAVSKPKRGRGAKKEPVEKKEAKPVGAGLTAATTKNVLAKSGSVKVAPSANLRPVAQPLAKKAISTEYADEDEELNEDDLIDN